MLDKKKDRLKICSYVDKIIFLDRWMDFQTKILSTR